MSNTRRYEIVEKTITCEECQQPKRVRCNKNVHRRYCDDCQSVVTRRRKKLERQQRLAKTGGKQVTPEKPRLVRYAGYDPGERN